MSNALFELLIGPELSLIHFKHPGMISRLKIIEGGKEMSHEPGGFFIQFLQVFE